jgi:hypothetical protein
MTDQDAKPAAESPRQSIDDHLNRAAVPGT